MMRYMVRLAVPAVTLALIAGPAAAGDLQESLSGASLQPQEAAKQSGDVMRLLGE